jgi:hypothetical protein
LHFGAGFNDSCLSANNLGTRVPNDPNVDDHATACAGIAASTHNNFSGIAPGAGTYSANMGQRIDDVTARVEARRWSNSVAVLRELGQQP